MEHSAHTYSERREAKRGGRGGGGTQDSECEMAETEPGKSWQCGEEQESREVLQGRCGHVTRDEARQMKIKSGHFVRLMVVFRTFGT